MFRIRQGDTGLNADTIDRARETSRGGKSGLYQIDEIRAEPFRSGHTSRGGGSLIRRADGWDEDEPHL